MQQYRRGAAAHPPSALTQVSSRSRAGSLGLCLCDRSALPARTFLRFTWLQCSTPCHILLDRKKPKRERPCVQTSPAIRGLKCYAFLTFSQLTGHVNDLSHIYEHIAFAIQRLQDEKQELRSKVDQLKRLKCVVCATRTVSSGPDFPPPPGQRQKSPESVTHYFASCTASGCP